MKRKFEKKKLMHSEYPGKKKFLHTEKKIFCKGKKFVQLENSACPPQLF